MLKTIWDSRAFTAFSRLNTAFFASVAVCVALDVGNKTDGILEKLDLDQDFLAQFTDRPVEIYDRSFVSYFRLKANGVLNTPFRTYLNPNSGFKADSLWRDRCNIVIQPGSMDPRTYLSLFSGIPERFIEYFVDDIDAIRLQTLVHELEHCNHGDLKQLASKISYEATSDQVSNDFLNDEHPELVSLYNLARFTKPILAMLAVNPKEHDDFLIHAVGPVIDGDFTAHETIDAYRRIHNMMKAYTNFYDQYEDYLAVYKSAQDILVGHTLFGEPEGAVKFILEKYIEAFETISPQLAKQLNTPSYEAVIPFTK